MSSSTTPSRSFEVGTTGWSTAGLRDAQVEKHWESGRYEIELAKVWD